MYSGGTSNTDREKDIMDMNCPDCGSVATDPVVDPLEIEPDNLFCHDCGTETIFEKPWSPEFAALVQDRNAA